MQARGSDHAKGSEDHAATPEASYGTKMREKARRAFHRPSDSKTLASSLLIFWGIPKVDSNTSSLPKVDSSVLTQIVIVVLRSKIDSDYGPRN